MWLSVSCAIDCLLLLIKLISDFHFGKQKGNNNSHTELISFYLSVNTGAGSGTVSLTLRTFPDKKCFSENAGNVRFWYDEVTEVISQSTGARNPLLQSIFNEAISDVAFPKSHICLGCCIHVCYTLFSQQTETHLQEGIMDCIRSRVTEKFKEQL